MWMMLLLNQIVDNIQSRLEEIGEEKGCYI